MGFDNTFGMIAYVLYLCTQSHMTCEPAKEDVKTVRGIEHLWRDRSAHAHDAVVGEGEAYMALRTLLRFATQVAEHWTRLSTPITTPAPPP